jgi:hypothetical protein
VIVGIVTLVLVGGLAVVAPAGASGSWARALEVPGSGNLNVRNNAQVASISCTTSGNCSAGGYFWGSTSNPGAFVVDEVNGVWGNAIEVPGITALAVNVNSAATNAISCSSPGNCAAGGTYSYGVIRGQAFVVDEVNGVWGNAIEVPGTNTLNTSTYAMVNAISCSSPGNCSAGGFYSYTYYSTEDFVVNEVDGTWGNVVSLDASNVNTISCSSPGNCTIGGEDETDIRNHDGSFLTQASVSTEIDGTWSPAIDIPGSATLNSGGIASVNSVSCTGTGECSAVGQYENNHSVNPTYDGTFQAFVANEVDGNWVKVVEAPRSGVLNRGGNAVLNSVSCASPGNCSAGGEYQSNKTTGQALVIDEVNGTWKAAEEVPHASVLNTGGQATVNAVSCSSPGNCSAGGFYLDHSGKREAFVVNQVNGAWDAAAEVPGIASLSRDWAEVDAISCSSTGYCSAGGKYSVKHGHEAFVVNG